MVERSPSTRTPAAVRERSDAEGHGGPRSVLMVTPAWSRDGGIATHVAASAAALAAGGVPVDVLVRRVVSPESFPGVRIHSAEQLMNPKAPLSERLGSAHSLTPGVVHFHQIEDHTLIAAFQRASPVAVSVHGYSACTSSVYYFRPGHECTRAHGPGCAPNLLLRGCAHTFDPRPLPDAYRNTTKSVRALRAADLAISYSSAVDRHLAANGVSRRRIVPLFTTMQATTAAGHETRRRVVFAGRIVASKGVSTLIRAARDVEAEFVICGEGWQLEAMRRLAVRCGVQDRVSFRGWLPAEQLARELAEASVVVLPSLWPEPFGLVGIEALSAGRPVIASATGGISDWLQDGVSGLLFRPGDARDLARRLAELLDDPERQARMGRAGAASVAERFSAERHVEGILDAYRAALLAWRDAPRGAPSEANLAH